MRSLAFTTPPSAPPSGATSSADEVIGLRLQRLCDLLGLDGARLTRIAAAGAYPVAAIGAAAANLAPLESRAMASAGPLVIADTAADTPGAARFYSGFVMPADAAHPSTLVSLFDSRPRSAAMAATIGALASEVVAQALISRQRVQIEAQTRTIADYAAVEEQRRSLFDRASATARIGIWQCNLEDNSITWTNGVYDLFEIPRNTPVTREISLARYTPASRQQMEAARVEAIANCSDFALDCEITTINGHRRWMRLTGAVESRDGVAHRIFGMKQDITEEKLMADRTRYLAEFDVMTGLANRSLFQSRLGALDNHGGGIGALLLIDLDGFKQVNDTYGHAVGDECLKEAALRLVESCGGAELVARIGGDEFAVLLKAGMAKADVEALAENIVAMMRLPVSRLGQTLKVGASVGVAHYRGDGTSDDLFRKADTALYAAKAAGRDTSCVFGG